MCKVCLTKFRLRTSYQIEFALVDIDLVKLFHTFGLLKYLWSSDVDFLIYTTNIWFFILNIPWPMKDHSPNRILKEFRNVILVGIFFVIVSNKLWFKNSSAV